ncbi:MAG: ribosome biogenesis GTPase Der [Verrucomicrobia bacterium]|nr:ribosome biogenesis GTPase Der [Verrucomicrobiota bacterium]
MPSVVTIVGKPNVGKSALFNRIAGRRIAIVHDMPGVTRDRVSAEVEWHGVPYTLIDTGGISLLKGEKKGDVITKSAMMQVELAIEEAELVLFVVDIQSGLTPLDQEVAEKLRRSQKKVFLVCNKADTNALDLHSHDFASFNFDRVFNVSAIHNRGIEGLMNAVIRELPQVPEEERHPAPAPQNDADEDQAEMIEGPLKIAFVGRPNVGKSSIVNKLTQSNRVIVSPIPGTTRDSVDVPFSVETDGVKQDYILVDTAGVRKERRVHDSVEFYSIKRTEDSINRCDIAILMLDASEGILEQDKKVADKIVDAGKACIIVVNKWDLVAEGVKKMQEKEAERIAKIPVYKRTEEDQKKLTLAEFGAWVQEKLFFLSYAPVIFTSAENGFNLDRLLEAVRYVAAQLKQVIPTGLLNRTLATAIEEKLPVSARGNFLKFYYATQVKQAPPTFLLFVNRKELIQDSYQKFLAAKMRQAFGYEGCPIHFISRARPKTIESKHKPRVVKRQTVKKYSTRGQQREQIEGRARLRKRIAPRDAARRKGK